MKVQEIFERITQKQLEAIENVVSRLGENGKKVTNANNLHILENMVLYPERYKHLIDGTLETADPNLKYANLNYRPQDGDVFSCMGRKIPMSELCLYALYDGREDVQAKFTWVYKHLSTGEMFEIEAEFLHMSGKNLDGLCYINTRKFEYDDNYFFWMCYHVFEEDFSNALRKHKITNLLAAM